MGVNVEGTIYGPFLGILGNIWGSLRSKFEASLSPVQVCLGALGASVRAVRGPLGASCGSLGASGGPLGAESLDFRIASPLLGLPGAVFGRS